MASAGSPSVSILTELEKTNLHVWVGLAILSDLTARWQNASTSSHLS